jgi:hypothetical protein
MSDEELSEALCQEWVAAMTGEVPQERMPEAWLRVSRLSLEINARTCPQRARKGRKTPMQCEDCGRLHF